MARRIESYLIDGPAGKLEALLEEPEDPAWESGPREAALVCHPHPAHGGTMHNKVVYRIARGLRRSGSVVLRFNFRGVGQSQGTYDEERGELLDASAALSWLRDRYPHLPYTLAGFSFGSRIVARLACNGTSPQRLILVGFPTRYGPMSELASCSVPKVFVHSTRDEYGPKEQLEQYVTGLHPPKQMLWIEAGDHFFRDKLVELEEAIHNLGSG